MSQDQVPIRWTLSSQPSVTWLFRMLRSVSAALLIAIAVVGCANRQSATVTSGEDISAYSNFYVVKFGPDGRGINHLIQNDLIRRGYEATTGPVGEEPEDTDVVVTYRDHWQWDITMYMIELSVTMQDPATNRQLAVGNSYHTSLTRLSPEEMVREVLSNIFAGGRTVEG